MFTVECDVLTDGHEQTAVALRYREPDADEWREAPMRPLGNDRWQGEIKLEQRGIYDYTIVAWRDAFATWLAQARAKQAAGQKLDVEFEVASGLLKAVADDGAPEHRQRLHKLRSKFDAAGLDEASAAQRLDLIAASATQTLLRAAAPRPFMHTYDRQLSVLVERKAAAFSAWYELTPRSQANDATRHGTFEDVIARLPYVRDMGFDVLYLTPIHPIGRTNRKGRNNSLVARSGDPGSPYAIGAKEGGHDAIHAELGDFDDFARARRGRRRARSRDRARLRHPVLARSSRGSRSTPSGSSGCRTARIRFAENPPKKYEDIVNVHFYGDAFPSLWLALRDVVLFWVEQGVKIFRVDNPHTKPFPFWEWLIREVQERDPDVIFLAEAFTRPQGHGASGEARLHAELLLLHLAQHQAGADRLSHRADARALAPRDAPELLRQHARHQPVLPADERPRRLPRASRAGSEPRRQLRRLQRL